MPGDHDHARRLPHVGLDSEHALAAGESAYGHAAKSEAILRGFDRLMANLAQQREQVDPIRVVAEVGKRIEP